MGFEDYDRVCVCVCKTSYRSQSFFLLFTESILTVHSFVALPDEIRLYTEGNNRNLNFALELELPPVDFDLCPLFLVSVFSFLSRINPLRFSDTFSLFTFWRDISD